MESIGLLGQWIAENESLLSGLVSIVVLAGLVLSPLGKGLRRWLRRTPSPQTAAAASAPAPARVVTRTADVSDPVIAVLAFDNLSSDPELQFFSDGISEEILQRLARGAKLTVIGRTSSFQFRGERKAEATRALDCSHVLDGAVRRSETRARISAHLVEAASGTTVWSDRYDFELSDLFAIQDEIAERIAEALDHAFAGSAGTRLDATTQDLYLRALPTSFAPAELADCIGRLEEVTHRAPDFAEAWSRLAYLRAWWHFYQPFADRPAIAERVRAEAERALVDSRDDAYALMAQVFVAPPFGRFRAGFEAAERLRRADGADRVRGYVGWYLRTLGHVADSLEEAERAYRIDALDPMTANLVALARMAAGRTEAAIPIYEDLVERVPGMSFPISSLLRAHALREDWDAVDRVLALAAQRDLREFDSGLGFIRTKRDPTPERLDAWRRELEAGVASTGCVDLSRLVYAAHLGLVDVAYALAEGAWLGPTGSDDDVMGPDGYRTSILFQAGMPELRDDPRFAPLCARLGLVGFWRDTGRWPDCADQVPYDFRAACAAAAAVPAQAFGIRAPR